MNKIKKFKLKKIFYFNSMTILNKRLLKNNLKNILKNNLINNNDTKTVKKFSRWSNL